MLKRYIYFLIFTLIFLSCNKEQPLQISAESFSEKQLELCKTVSCPEISINYIKAIGEEEPSEKINKAITGFIIASLYMGDDESGPSATTISDAAIQFIEMYRTHSAEFPDMQLEYFAEINIQETYITPNFLSLEMRQYQFTGGAHGYGSTHFMNFDPQTGLELTLEELFADIDGFTDLAENKFKEIHEIPQEDDINSTGFWFDDDKFYLPETVGFLENSIVFIYNQYDIASYAAGPIELEIPLKEVTPYLANPLQ